MNIFSKKTLSHYYFGQLTLEKGLWCGEFSSPNCSDESIEIFINEEEINSKDVFEEAIDILGHCSSLLDRILAELERYVEANQDLFFKLKKDFNQTHLSLEAVAIETDSIKLFWGLTPLGADENEVQIIFSYIEGKLLIIESGD